MDGPVRRRVRGLLAAKPHWIVRDVVIVLAIGLCLATLQFWMDDRRSDREQRQDNLRFVRELSLDPDSTRGRLPFRSIDLTGMNLSLLSLPDADFSGALLDDAVFEGADLSGGLFAGASLRGADLRDVKLFGALFDAATFDGASLEHATVTNGTLVGSSFQGTDFTDVYLWKVNVDGADFRGARNLAKAQRLDVCYDVDTKWPPGFEPPASQKGCPAFVGGGGGI